MVMNTETGHVICTDKWWRLSLSKSMIANYESLQHHVGGSTGSTVSAGQIDLLLGGPVH